MSATDPAQKRRWPSPTPQQDPDEDVAEVGTGRRYRGRVCCVDRRIREPARRAGRYPPRAGETLIEQHLWLNALQRCVLRAIARRRTAALGGHRTARHDEVVRFKGRRWSRLPIPRSPGLSGRPMTGLHYIQ